MMRFRPRLLTRTWLSVTRWFRPRVITIDIDVDRGVIEMGLEEWSWRRWRWEHLAPPPLPMGLAALMGKWPGDESDETLYRVLDDERN